MQRTRTSIDAKAAINSAVALMLATLGAPAARADVTIGDDWDLVVGGAPGQNLYDGFMSYSGNGVVSEVRGGNTWGKFSVSNPYWGQFTGHSWGNAAITVPNFNAHTTLEFDIDLSQFQWGSLSLRLGTENSDGAAGTQAKVTGPTSLSHLLVPLPSPTGNPIIQHVSMDISSLHPLTEDSSATWMNLVPWLDIGYWGYWDEAAAMWRDTGNSFTPQSVFFDNMRITTDAVKVNAARTDNADAAWSVGWTGGVPSGAGHTANFGPSSSAAHTITTDAPVTLGVLNFYTTSSQTVSGTESITLTGATGVAAAINVAAGNHTIATPLVISGGADISVTPAASTLTVADLRPSAGAIKKSGAGTLAVNGIVADALIVDAGAVEVLANGGNLGTTRVKSLTVADGAKLHLNDNDLIVDYAVGETSPEFVLRDHVKAFRDNPAATTGISFTRGSGDRVIAIAEKTEWGKTEFNGVAIDDTTVIGKYTYYGDANLDGKVDSNDYVAVDVGLGNGNSWVQGDFNFDGTVTSDDYVAIDTNLGKGVTVGDPLAMAELKAEMIALHTAQFGDAYVRALAVAEEFGYTALVPEPGALMPLVAAGYLVGRRRSKRTGTPDFRAK